MRLLQRRAAPAAKSDYGCPDDRLLYPVFDRSSGKRKRVVKQGEKDWLECLACSLLIRYGRYFSLLFCFYSRPKFKRLHACVEIVPRYVVVICGCMQAA